MTTHDDLQYSGQRNMAGTIGNLRVHVFEDRVEAARRAGGDIARCLSDARKRGRNVLFLSSGGSSLAILDFIPYEVLGGHLTVGVLDERYDRGEDNNFVQLSRTGFYRKAVAAGAGFVDTSVKAGQTDEALADHFESELREWRRTNPDGEIVATIGIGPDGHTSGIMPFPEDEVRFEALFNAERWVVAYDASGKSPHPKRVTTTLTFLRLISRAFVFACGREKADALRRLQEERPPAEVPAAVLKELRGDLYVDAELSGVFQHAVIKMENRRPSGGVR